MSLPSKISLQQTQEKEIIEIDHGDGNEYGDIVVFGCDRDGYVKKFGNIVVSDVDCDGDFKKYSNFAIFDSAGTQK